jgi:hypothetical protein
MDINQALTQAERNFLHVTDGNPEAVLSKIQTEFAGSQVSSGSQEKP